MARRSKRRGLRKGMKAKMRRRGKSRKSRMYKVARGGIRL